MVFGPLSRSAISRSTNKYCLSRERFLIALIMSKNHPHVVHIFVCTTSRIVSLQGQNIQWPRSPSKSVGSSEPLLYPTCLSITKSSKIQNTEAQRKRHSTPPSFWDRPWEVKPARTLALAEINEHLNLAPHRTPDRLNTPGSPPSPMCSREALIISL